MYVTYVDPASGGTQRFEARETARRAILERAGWRQTAEPAEEPETSPAVTTALGEEIDVEAVTQKAAKTVKRRGK